MISLLRTLAFPILGLILMILGNSLFTSFISLRLELAGSSREMIGIVVSTYYGGTLLGSIRSISWIARLGHFRALIALCAANSALILMHSLWIDPYYWIALRFFGGLCMGALFVIVESWFLLSSTLNNRSQALSLYLLIFYFSLAIGQQLLNIADLHSPIPYCVASLLSSLSILPIVIGAKELTLAQSDSRFSLKEIIKSSPAGFCGGIISGILIASIFGLAPIYGQEIGLVISEVATFISILVLGGLALQFPLGKWADSSSRVKVLILSCFAAAFFAILIAVLEEMTWPIWLSFAGLFGGFSFALYPLSMSLICENVEEGKVVAATSGFILAYGIGAITGPLIAPVFMNWMGAAGLFYFHSLICLLLGLIGSVTYVGKRIPSK